MKTNTKHTAGEWLCDGMLHVSEHTPNHLCVYGPDGKALIAQVFYGRTAEESAANSRLIASAPALLEALRGVLACHGPVSTVAESAKALREAEAAIAAATGEGV